MPFSNKSDVIVHDIGISKNGGMFRGSASKSAWLQFTPLNKQAYNFVADAVSYTHLDVYKRQIYGYGRLEHNINAQWY